MDLYSSLVDSVGFVVALIALIIVMVGLFVFLFGRVILFRKCNYPGWKALVPFYGTYVFFTNICGLHWAWYLAYILIDGLTASNTTVQFLNMFVKAMAFYNLAIRCNKDKIPSMIFGGIASPIVTMVYALSNIEYHPEIEVKQSGIF